MKLLRILFAVVVVLALSVAVLYRSIPTRDTDQPHLDTIIVLGYPANSNGTPSPEQRERVLEAIREYRAGVAPRMIMTGGAAHNTYTEAHVMAVFARSQGVPDSDILEEPQAQNTIQNIFYSAELLHQHGWHSAEIVSSPSHLPRASLILATFDCVHPELAIRWHSHAARWPQEYSGVRKLIFYTAEAAYCARLRLEGFPPSPFLPPLTGCRIH